MIEGLLSGINPPTSGETFTFTNVTVGTSVGTDTADLELRNVSLSFSGLDYSSGSWTGDVAVTAQTGVLFPGLLNIPVADSNDDADVFAVVGIIDLAVDSDESYLALDDIDGEAIGVPSFLDVQFTSLVLNFNDFRENDNANTLDAGLNFLGFDTGIDELNALMAEGTPLFQLTLVGTASTSLDLAGIEASIIASPPSDIVAAFQEGLAADAGTDLQNGVSLDVSGKIFHVGDITGKATYRILRVDPDGDGPLSEQTSGYVALNGSFQFANQELGGRGPKFELAFAISDLGPLQFYISKSPTEAAPDATPPPPGTIIVESANFGVIFSKTIEQLQNEIDYVITGPTTSEAAGTKFSVTLTIPEHDFEKDDALAIVEADSPNYVGEYTVADVDGDKVTVLMDANPGALVGDASIIRRTIKDPLDLRDSGIQTGHHVGSIEEWNASLDASVEALIVAGDNVWAQMFGNMVIGGGATLSISDIPDTVLMMDVSMYLDTHMQAMLQGNLILADGLVQVPASMYGDLSDLFEGEGRLLFLADVGQVPLVDDPLLVLRGEASFAPIEDNSTPPKVIGLQIALEGGVDLNIPEATTITLEGTTTLSFSATSMEPLFAGPDLQIDLEFDAALSEAEIGDIAAVRGNFHMAIDVPNPDPNNPQLGSAEIWGAAILTTQFDFLEDVGLDVDASAVLRVNSSSTDKPVEVLLDATNQPVNVALPKESFALRLDGSADFEINDESMARLGGIFVLEFSSEGFNVALFDEVNGQVEPASIAIGPAGSRLLVFEAYGFLAIREDGIAADMVLRANADLPFGLAELHANAVLVVNTTGKLVEFDIPGGLDPDHRTSGLSVTIPKAAPSNPGAIIASGLNGLINNGSPSWAETSAGPYGVVFVAGDLNVLSVLTLDVSGYILLSEDVVSLQADFDANAKFLDLVEASVSGSLFFSSEGEFQVLANGNVRLGPDGFNIAGTAALNISYLDSNGTASGGDQSFVLDVGGSVGVSAEIFYIPIGPLTIGIDYNSATGNISVLFEDVPVPEIAWTTLDLGLLGSVDIPYPTITLKDYPFTVGTLTATLEQPPTPVLGQVDNNGVLTLNVGSRSGERLFRIDELNEIVSFAGKGVGSVAGTEEIDVTMFGVTQRFHNVTKILIEDMGAGEDYVGVLASVVSTPVEVRFGAGNDTLDSDSSTIVKAFGGDGQDRLEGGGGNDELNGGANEDYIDGGAGNDIIDGGDAADRLVGGVGADTIRGGQGADTIAGDGATTGTVLDANNVVTSFTFETVASAAGGSDAIEGGSGDDTIFGGSAGDTINGNGGVDRILGEDGRVTIAIGSAPVYTPLNLGSGGADHFTWAVGDGNDTVDGQLGSDTLNLFGTDLNPEAFTISASGAGFTAAVGPASLSASSVETSNIEGRTGSDSFTVNDLTGSVLQQINLKLGSDSVQDVVEINGASGADVFSIATTVANTLQVVKGALTIDVQGTSSTSGGDTITLDTKAGRDTIHVRVTLVGTLTTVNGGDGDDRIHVGNSGNLSGIAGKLVVQGGADTDNLNLDDTADATANTGNLTATQITGLGMGSDGITYAGLETLNVNLGLGGDTVSVQDTANGTASTINTGGGNDQVTVYKTSSGGPITLDGQAAADTFNIHLGSLAAPVTVSDSGAIGSDVLNVNGIAGVNEIVLEFAKLTRGTDVVNYSGVEALNIDTHDAGDVFTMLDNGAATTINSGKGEDGFTIGPEVNLDGEVVDKNGNGNADELLIKGTSFVMTINGGDDGDDFEVNRNTGELFLNGENGDDVFVLNTLITGGDSTVDGGGDADEITYLQNAPVHINGGDGFDTIIVNGSKLNDVFIITGTTINVVGSRLVDYVEIESLEANGRRGLDTFTVDTTIDGSGNPLASSALQKLAVNGQQDNDLVELRGMLIGITATFSGGSENDTFHLKSLAPLTVNAIDGPVTINGDDGQDALNVCDTGDTIANTGALTSTKLTGLGMYSGVTCGTLEALNISLGSGSNTFTIQDTHTGSTVLNSGPGGDTVNVRAVHGPTTVNAETGHDTINVGSLAPYSGGTLNQIVSALTVNGGGANPDTLNVDDTGDATSNSGCLTATTLTGLGMGVGITYGTLEVLNVSLGAGSDTFTVKGTAAGTATTLNSGNGNDVLTVDSNGALPNGTVNDVVSSLTINGQGGFNVLTMEDYSDVTGDTVHVTPTQIGAAVGDTFFGTGGSLTYSKLDQVTLNMSQAYLPDTIYLTPSRLGTECFIRGREPQTPMQRAQLPGDALYLDFTGLTPAERLGVRLNATGLNNPADPVFNIWNTPGHGRVNYKQIEKMNHVQTLAIGADLGGSEPRVRVIDAETGLEKLNFLAYDAGFKGGVRVAVGDVNGDAIPDIITSAGPGGGPLVRVFNGATGARFTEPIGEFFAFAAGSKTTVQVAVADINLDGLADIITGSDSGGQPLVKVFDAHKLLTGQANPVISQFFAYDKNFAGGVRLAVGDLNNDGMLDIVTGPGSGLNSQVRVFRTNLSADQTTVSHSLLTSFNAFPKYNGGVNLAVGDVTGDGKADIVVGTGTGGTAMARIYNGAPIASGKPPALVADFKPYGTQSGGVRVALVDLDGDGVNELITASALTGSKVKPKAFDFLPNGPSGLTPAAIDAYFASYASDPFFQGARFLGGGN